MLGAFEKGEHSNLGDVGNLVLQGMKRVPPPATMPLHPSSSFPSPFAENTKFCEDNDKLKKKSNKFKIASKMAKGVQSSTTKKKAPTVEYASPASALPEEIDLASLRAPKPAADIECTRDVMKVPTLLEIGSFNTPAQCAQDISPRQKKITVSDSPEMGVNMSPSLGLGFSPSRSFQHMGASIVPSPFPIAPPYRSNHLFKFAGEDHPSSLHFPVNMNLFERQWVYKSQLRSK